MKKLNTCALPWKRMGRRDVADPGQHVTPEDCYDYGNAVTAKTRSIKPRTVALSNFTKQKSRDEMLLKTSDAYANVLLENSREDRELEIQARKEQQKKYAELGLN